MSNTTLSTPLSRRKALTWGANITAALVAASTFTPEPAQGQSSTTAVSTEDDDSKHIFQEIEQIIQAQGSFSNGVFSIEIDRNDITGVTLRGVPILPHLK